MERKPIEICQTKNGETFYKHYCEEENRYYNMFDVDHITTPTKDGKPRKYHYVPKTISYKDGDIFSRVERGTPEWFKCLKALESFFEPSTKVDK